MVDAGYLLCSLLFCSIAPEFVTSTSRLPGVQNYQVVKPRQLHIKQKRESEGLYPSVVQYGIPVEGKDLVIHLEKNEGLFAKNYSESYTLENGTEVWDTPLYLDHCYYLGYVQGEEGSSASFSTCGGLSGYIRTKGQRYLMEQLRESLSDEHALYRYEELTLPLKTCGVVNTSWDNPEPRVENTFSSTSERNEFLNSKKYIEMYVVADHSEFQQFGSVAAVRRRVFEAVNHINLLYRPLKTHVALIGLEVWSGGDKISVRRDSTQTLQNILNWRNQQLLPKKQNDNIQFITSVDFDGDTIGLAPVSGMCTGNSGAINQDHTSNVHGVASTMAHEMGHNLGMDHDNNVCLCNSKSCIMSPVLNSVFPTEFSSCSHQNFQSFTLTQTASCLRDVPSQDDIVAASICGNRFVEQGEDCDCGSPTECQNRCCDPQTCKLREEAECADGECCQDCKIKAASSLCRHVKDECDLSENCDGKSNKCPKDAFRLNGTPCKSGTGFCYNGKCPTYQDQCSSLWGKESRKGSNQCFQTNRRGDEYGYCKQTTTYQPCRNKDIMCGQLYCVGGKSLVPFSTGRITIGSIECQVILDKNGVNPGLVENGMKCGDNKMCLNAECVEVRVNTCSKRCPQHTECNHLEQCQFEEGFTPQSNLIPVTVGQITERKEKKERRPPITVIIIIIVIVVAIIIVIGTGFFVFRKCTAKRTLQPRIQPSGLTNPAFAGSTPGIPQMQHVRNPKGPMQIAPPPPPYFIPFAPNHPAKPFPPQPPATNPNLTPMGFKPFPPQPPATNPNLTPMGFKPFPPQPPATNPNLTPMGVKVLMPPTRPRY